jgi:hypothetical protein
MHVQEIECTRSEHNANEKFSKDGGDAKPATQRGRYLARRQQDRHEERKLKGR